MEQEKNQFCSVQVLAHPSESFILPRRTATPLPYSKACYHVSNDRQQISHSIRQPEVFCSAIALFSPWSKMIHKWQSAENICFALGIPEKQVIKSPHPLLHSIAHLVSRQSCPRLKKKEIISSTNITTSQYLKNGLSDYAEFLPEGCQMR